MKIGKNYERIRSVVYFIMNVTDDQHMLSE